MLQLNKPKKSEFREICEGLQKAFKIKNENLLEHDDQCTSNVIIPNYEQFTIPDDIPTPPKVEEKKGLLIQGLIYLPRPKKKFPYDRELTLFLWFLANVMFWLNVIHIWPCATVSPIDLPLWKDRPVFKRPEVNDYIIEPDWDSGGKSKEES